ncbi:MAG: hypothetical protein IOC64_07685 [Methylobacterium sp.]|nr:hypothetical protein [Methylobacterium sp.]MCA3606173.1 hypothetical protein [Methylobacterium sp.]MCA3609291.1 hypothetical protein [Methylobacterium sp.]MCA3618372.1 hypothetical protein [Methylobacterium sp.]MCA3621971.1 hypothetical protein [Methylobacterium sp.]
MSPDERLRILLAKGYFPPELPDAFTTESFGASAGQIASSWVAAGLVKYEPIKKGQLTRDGSFKIKIGAADAEILTKPKKGFERRNFHITHPIPQLFLSKTISHNWRTIAKWISKQKYSVDRIEISDLENRGLKNIKFDVHRIRKSFIDTQSSWIVKTDITRFYPSIYTHSIAWAAYGRSKVKQKMSTYVGSLADQLDVLVRACNQNQTIGIPIGPETSRILAEIISARIDDHFSVSCPPEKFTLADRLQDDWYIGSNSLHDAERVISEITKAYRDFGLEINGSKTDISQAIGKFDPEWISEISGYLVHAGSSLRRSTLREFLSLAIRMQVKFPFEPVTNYVLTVLERGLSDEESDVVDIESYLLKSVLLWPLSIGRICTIILNMNHFGLKIAINRIIEKFSSILLSSIENGHYFEALWSLYLIRGLKRRVLGEKRVLENIETFKGSTIPLVLLDMKSKGQAGRLPTASWEKEIAASDLTRSSHWLLAYEAGRRGWLKLAPGQMTSGFFSPLHQNSVSFYDETKNVANIRRISRDRQSSKFASYREARHVLKMLRLEEQFWFDQY